MKQLYSVFKDAKVAPMVRQLSWSHCLLLLPLKSIDKIYYYASKTANKNLSKRQLEEIIKAREYERLPIETKNKLISEVKVDVKELVPNPILIRNKNNIEIVTEKALHSLILEDIESFMKELGNSFSFIGSEYKIKIDGKNNYIDLLLFNYEYNCFVVVELKITELRKEHIGQIQIYMNYIDKHLKSINQDKTIGIIICKRDNKYIIEYATDERIISRTYELL